MGDLDQGQSPLTDRLAEQVGDTVFRHDEMDVGPGDGGGLTLLQSRLDAGALAILGGRRQADDRLAALGSGRAPYEIGLGRYPAVELTLELIGANLAREIDGEGLCHRDHLVIRCDRLELADTLDGLKFESRVVIDKVVEPFRSHAVAGYDFARMQGLLPACDDTFVDEVGHGFRDHVGVNAEISTVVEVFQHFVRNPSEPDLQRRAVVDNACDIARDFLCTLFRRRMQVLDHGAIDHDKPIDRSEGNSTVSAGPRHGWIDLGDDPFGSAQGGRYQVHRDPQRAHAFPVGWGDLNQGHIDRNPADVDEVAHLGHGDRHVVRLALFDHLSSIAADEEDPVTEPSEWLAVVDGNGTIGQRVDELEIGPRCRGILEGLDQSARSRASRSNEHMVARVDSFEGLLRGDGLVPPSTAARWLSRGNCHLDSPSVALAGAASMKMVTLGSINSRTSPSRTAS